MPVQVVYRYFPHLSAWDMKHIVLFPRVRYFSFVSASILLLLHKLKAHQMLTLGHGIIGKVTQRMCIPLQGSCDHFQ